MPMKQTAYSTRDIAAAVGVHVNTVRFYEEIGFITKPERRPNGYRVYTRLQLEQCRVVRRAMRAEVLQNGLRQKAVEIVRLCAALDFDGACAAALEYRDMLDAEIVRARQAADTVQNALGQSAREEPLRLNRREAAERLGVTGETLRTWERSGLLTVRRRENGYRVYDAADMARLNIIRTLRCANYSLAAILRLLNRLEQSGVGSVETVLDTPDDEEDVLSACDRLIASLTATRADADALRGMIEALEKETSFSTLQ